MKGNSTRRGPPSLEPGVYCAMLTFFNDSSEELDLPTIRRHAVHLMSSGITGLVTMGSNGEAPHLSREERIEVTQTTRSALEEAGFRDTPLIMGCSDQSVRGTLQLCQDAATAGADAALVLPPSYFRGAVSDALIKRFYTQVADISPLPVILYSYPDVVAGVMMNSDLLIELSQHPNIVGTKFTCGDTGKLRRVATAMNAATAKSRGSGYLCLGGLADFALQCLVAGGSGYIAGGANIVPKGCVKVWDLFQKGKIEEAMSAQAKLSDGDWYHTKDGVAATKAILEKQHGYGGVPRQPLGMLDGKLTANLLLASEPVLEWENSL